jgi:Zn finger protein HypA/HybF involved in hydrogenase expression
MSLKFQKKVEDFTCEHCGKEVKGNGFTNHCPYCLWSKHVDTNPGDRASLCLGMMEPKDVIHETKEYHLITTCVRCGYSKKNRIAKNDDFDVAIKVVEKKAKDFMRLKK